MAAPLNVFEANGYHYLDEPEPRIPACGPHLSGTVFDFDGCGRHIRFFCVRLTLADCLDLDRIGRRTWQAFGLRGPLYLGEAVQQDLDRDRGLPPVPPVLPGRAWRGAVGR
ncbi:hypothetical protein GXW83_10605 [Streptacidiphilus sp. PB12-B1b]|uniref:hypothetical protein n=1 Tax=Streptacidiphilus sp. PB12-B1b TaxID=2705012 RepID=UPI0015FD126D|nr:hypothetical protein [Streptacidiphilus sp. PB12-B1b]QMU76120.1 hypothetical protein GXW83_10605 [Streptacidiphilus sp. PB12-B1b]